MDLEGALMSFLAPGVDLKVSNDTPLYHACPYHPQLVVQVLNGVQTRGFFSEGKFVPCQIYYQPKRSSQ